MSIQKLMLFAVFCLLTVQNGFAQVSYCQGGRFKPCVCAGDVPKTVSYRPSYPGCGGNAAILTRGKYLNIFSVVVRDNQNRDRWPAAGSGFGGCSKRLANSAAPPNRCSAFKVQKKYVQETENGLELVSCLGAKGTSRTFSKVVRMTAKLADVPNSTADPLARWCLNGPTVPLN